MKRFDSSTSPDERQKLSAEVQAYLLDKHVTIPVLRQAFINAVWPRVASPTDDVIGSISRYGDLGPYEDVALQQ